MKVNPWWAAMVGGQAALDFCTLEESMAARITGSSPARCAVGFAPLRTGGCTYSFEYSLSHTRSHIMPLKAVVGVTSVLFRTCPLCSLAYLHLASEPQSSQIPTLLFSPAPSDSNFYMYVMPSSFRASS